ncbi:MAG: hypothetical protein AB7F35_31395 [Acetobacteraceae bacterium]
MARKPDFSHLAVVQTDDPEPPQAPAELPVAPTTSRAGGLRSRSQPVALYLSFEFHKELARYAVEQSGPKNKVRPHDLLIQAVEEWAQRRGINVRVRAPDDVR